MERIAIDQIGYDPKFYPRVNGDGDWLTVHKYADALQADSSHEFPPIVVVRVNVNKGYKFLILDGKHRTTAYTRAGRASIPAIVEHLPESKWFARSVELNAMHGRTLDSGDKAWIAVRMEQDGYSVEDVAKLLCMRVESLEKIKAGAVQKIKASNAKAIPIGRSHREVGGKHVGFLKSPFKEFAGYATGEAALIAQAPVNSRNVLSILDSAIAVMECGLDMTNEEIVGRIERIRYLLPDVVLS